MGAGGEGKPGGGGGLADTWRSSHWPSLSPMGLLGAVLSSAGERTGPFGDELAKGCPKGGIRS